MNNYQFLFLEREQGNFDEYLHRGQGIRGWLVYEREQSEINANRRIEAETY